MLVYTARLAAFSMTLQHCQVELVAITQSAHSSATMEGAAGMASGIVPTYQGGGS
jgi:hypothetical protein